MFTKKMSARMLTVAGATALALGVVSGTQAASPQTANLSVTATVSANCTISTTAVAFGEYDPDLVFFEDRALFPAEVEPGMQFDGPPEGAKTPGLSSDAIYTVTEVYPQHVVLDGNHPLAGIALRLALVVRDVREATDEEVEAGSVGSSAVSVLASPPPGSPLH